MSRLNQLLIALKAAVENIDSTEFKRVIELLIDGLLNKLLKDFLKAQKVEYLHSDVSQME